MRRVPYRGVPQTVEAMKVLAAKGQSHPKIRDHAVGVIRNIQPKDHLSEVAALYYDTLRRIRYTRDPEGAELLHHPAVLHDKRAGDCDDMAIYLGAALGAAALSVGNPTEFVTAGFRSGARVNRYTHVFLRAKVGDQWLVLDPVAGPHSRQMLSRVTQYRRYPV